jgi:hypothetical protein
MLCALESAGSNALNVNIESDNILGSHNESFESGSVFANACLYSPESCTGTVNMTSGCTCMAVGIVVSLHVIYMSGTRIKVEEVRSINSSIPHLGKLPGCGLVSTRTTPLYVCRHVESGPKPDSLIEETDCEALQANLSACLLRRETFLCMRQEAVCRLISNVRYSAATRFP